MLKKIDRYIIGKYLATFFVIIILIISLASAFDFSERLDSFMGRGDVKPKVREILLDYYLNFAIFFANAFSPFFAFIAVIFFTSRMASRLEIISILSTGTSYWRLLRPFLMTAIFIASLNWISANFIIPKANLDKMKFEKKYFGRVSLSFPNIHRQYSDSEFVYVKNFNFATNIGGAFAYEKFVDGQLTKKIMCHTLVYDTLNTSWKLQDYIVRDLHGLKEKMSRGSVMDTIFPFTPDLFKTEMKVMITMSNAELDEFIKQEKAKGSKYVNIYLLEKHQRNANPFAIIIMTLLAVPIASRKVRGGIGFHLATGVGLAFIYIYIGKVFTASAATGGIDPFWALWIPNVLFLILAAVLVRFAQK
jgi:lipopolysaccharide export system permease protein